MPLSLADVDQLFMTPGTLLSRVRGACGIISRGWFMNHAATDAQRTWAAAVNDDPTGVATSMYKGIITTPSIMALDMDGLIAGTLPSDADLIELIEYILSQYLAGSLTT